MNYYNVSKHPILICKRCNYMQPTDNRCCQQCSLQFRQEKTTNSTVNDWLAQNPKAHPKVIAKAVKMQPREIKDLRNYHIV
jgi:hypothetical protein